MIAKEIISTLMTPVGHPKGTRPTSSSIQSYRNNEPNALKRLPYMAYLGTSLLASALMFGVSAYRSKDGVSTALSSAGGALGLGTIGASLIGEITDSVFPPDDHRGAKTTDYGEIVNFATALMKTALSPVRTGTV